MRRMSKAPKAYERQVSGDDDGVGRGEAAFEHPGDGKQDAARHAQGELKKGPRLRHPRMLHRDVCAGSPVQGPVVQGPGSGVRSPQPRYNARVQARYPVAIGVVFGLLLGLGGYTFIYARGGSYLGSDPKRAPTATSCASSSRAGSARAIEVSRSATIATRRTISSGSTDEGSERILALVLLHHRHVPRAHPDHATQRRGHRRRVPLLPRRHRPRHRHIPRGETSSPV